MCKLKDIKFLVSSGVFYFWVLVFFLTIFHEKDATYWILNAIFLILIACRLFQSRAALAWIIAINTLISPI